MSLTELIAGVESHRKTLTVYNAADDVVSDLRERFADRNVEIESGTADGEPGAFAVLSDGGEFVSGASVAELVAPRFRTTLAFAEASYELILDHLDETLFTSYDQREMLAATREIEDRAWRADTGELHAGFQTMSALADQVEIYERFGAESDVAVYAYAYPDESVPDHDGFEVSVDRSEEVRRTWSIAFDGGGVETNKCGLVAEERDPDSYYGFWTYDPATVDTIIDRLSDSRRSTESGGRPPGN